MPLMTSSEEGSRAVQRRKQEADVALDQKRDIATYTPIASSEKLERVMGIEPTYAAWEAAVLPLNYTRIAGRRSSERAIGGRGS